MRAFRTLSINTKLTLISVATSMTMLLLASSVFLVFETLAYRNAIVSEVESLAHVVGANSTAALTFWDEEVAASHLATFEDRPNFMAVAICDLGGRVLAQFRRQADAGRPLAVESHVDGRSWGHGRLSLAAPVTLDGKRIGTVFIAYSLQSFHRRILWYVLVVVLILAATTLVAGLLSRRLHAIVSRPVMDLADVASRISRQEDYSVRAIKVSDDEIGLLVDAFNDMLSQIQVRDADLSESYRSLNAQQKRLRSLTSQLQTVEEREKRKLATDLHDSVCQILWGARLQLEILQRKTDREEQDAALLAQAYDLVTQAMAQARSLSFQLSPPDLYELGLESALANLAVRIDESQAVEVLFVDDQQPKALNDTVSILVFRAVQELVQNAVKHAAASRITIEISKVDGSVQTVVSDDGRGFREGWDSGETFDRKTYGLFSIGERVREFGGELGIDSEAGVGAKVTLRVPLGA